MKPWVWIVAAFALVLLILFAIPQTRCTLTGGQWANLGGFERCW